MILEIAWKNVWRNKSRSLIVILSVAVGVFACIFSMAAINSSVVQRIDAAVNEELSHIQVNNREFRSSSDITDMITDFESVSSSVQNLPGVNAVTGRIVIRGIATTSAKSSGVEINGIDVHKEYEMFTLHRRIIPGTGTWFGSDTKFNSVLIGEKLARELNIIRFIISPEAVAAMDSLKIPGEVLAKIEPIFGQRFTSEKKFSRELSKRLTPDEIKRYSLKIKETAWSYREGSKIILTFLDMDNNQTGAAFRVSGIFRTNNDMFEGLSVFVPEGELRTLTGMEENMWHRLIARLDDSDLSDRLTEMARSALPDYEVLNWKEIQPDLAMIADYMEQIYAVFMIIILAALSFGIVNTMLMAVLERTRELGMLAAIGMNRRKMFIMIMLESIFLSITGGFAGMGIAQAVISATQKNGINLMKYSEGMEAFGYSAHLFPTIDAGFFVTTTILIVITGILSSVYPARKALRLNPVEAIRTE
jgi:ABC-type lipoprotein release transport system permease subunit